MKILERVTTVAVLVAAVLVSASIMREKFLTGTAARTSRRQGARSPAVGTKLPLAEGALGTKASIVLAISTRCHFCAESMPFYKQLSALRDRASPQLALLAVFPEPADIGAGFLVSHGIAADRVIQSRLSGIGVSAMPTLVVLDASGSVRQAWVGVLKPPLQR